MTYASPRAEAYATATSVPPGGRLELRISGSVRHVVIRDVARGEICAQLAVDASSVTFHVPPDWRSSLFRAEFDDVSDPVYFVVRPVDATGAQLLVSVPFLTWQAYNRLGVPGEGLYLTEQPDRAVRVSLDRPGGVPEGWEEPFYRWLWRSGYRPHFCSNLDLHSGAVRLAGYQLLICQGHDEYWTWEMRDAVEAFIDAGGNLAVFSGNTCWWQVRLEDDLRTLVCYRDATRDPMSAVDPRRTTVEWSAAPVDRPENSMTGVGFRHGAGCWEDRSVMAAASYRVRFAEHWVFAGTGLRDGDEFGHGAVGYETDAADFEEVDGVPRVTGRDGTPRSFVVLATADLRRWRRYGQGGWATMGIFRRGLGTVFTASTIAWGTRMDDPVLDRITRTVLDRLSRPTCRLQWTDVGSACGIVSLAGCETRLYAVDTGGRLLARDPSPQNLAWRELGRYPGLRLLTAPRETDAGHAIGLYGLFADGGLRYRDPDDTDGPWTELCVVPAGTAAVTLAHKGLFAAGEDGALRHLPLTGLRGGTGWRQVDEAPGLLALASSNGQLFGLTGGGRLVVRLPATRPLGWRQFGPAAGMRTLAAIAGRLVAGGADGRLYWRDVSSVAGLEGGEA